MITTTEMQLMIELAAKALVDMPTSISVEQIEIEDGLTFRVWCADDDIGKLIGVNGKTARALRTIVTCAGKASSLRYVLDITDNRHLKDGEYSILPGYDLSRNA